VLPTATKTSITASKQEAATCTTWFGFASIV